MSGSTGVQVAPYNPNAGLDTLTRLQSLTNAQTSNKLQQQQILNAQQENTNLGTTNTGMLQDQAMKRYDKNASLIFGLNGLSDSDYGPAVQRAIDDEKRQGLIQQQDYDTIQNKLNQAKISGNYGGLRQDMTAAAISRAPTPEALARAVQGAQHAGYSGITPLPGPGMEDTGPTIQPTTGGQPFGTPIKKDVAPTILHQPGGDLPYNAGGKAGPGTVMPYGLSPGEALKPETRPVYNKETGNYDMVTKNAGDWNPGANPPIVNGGKGGPIGTGNYSAPATAMPMGTASQLESDQKSYQSDKEQIPTLQTGTQSLGKALKALNLVATGAGTEGEARMRAYVVSLGNVTGIDTGGINQQDMNRAQLEKYLTDYARMSGTAGRSDAGLEAAFKSNASGSINNSAAQDVVRTNIGRDRQKLASTLQQNEANPQGVGYTTNKGNVQTTTDPRGFAWDSYTDKQKEQILKEVGPPGSPGYKKLAKARGMAEHFNLLDPSFHLPDNVNTSPDNTSAVPSQQQLQAADAATRARQGNSLQTPPQNLLGGQ